MAVGERSRLEGEERADTLSDEASRHYTRPTRFGSLYPWINLAGLTVALAIAAAGYFLGDWPLWLSLTAMAAVGGLTWALGRAARRSVQGYLRKSEFLERAVERSVDDYLVISSDGEILRHSARLPIRPFVNAEGFEEEGLKVQGSNIETTLDLELVDHLQKYLRKKGPGRGSEDYRFSFDVEHSGEQLSYEGVCFPTYDSKVQGRATAVLLDERTKETRIRRNMEERIEELSSRERRFRTMVENATEAIFLLSLERREVIDANEKAETLTGIVKHDLIGTDPLELFEGEARDRMRHWLQVIDQYQRTAHIDVQLTREDGTVIDASISLGSISEDGEPMAIALARDISQRKRLEKEMFESNKVISAINELSKLINESLDLGRIFDVMVEKVREMVDAEVIVLATLEKRRTLSVDDLSDSTEQSLWQRSMRLDSSYERLWNLLRGKNAFRVVKLDSDPSAEGLESTVGPDTEEVMLLRLKHRDDLVGLLILESSENDAFGQREIEFMLQVGNLLSNALRNSELLAKERRNNLLFGLINEFSERSLRSLRTEELIEEAAQDILRIFNFSNVTILLADEEREKLVVEEREGIYKGSSSALEEVDFGEGLVGRAFTQARTMVSQNTSQDPRFLEDIPGGTHHLSEVAIPLGEEDQLIGVLDLQTLEPHSISNSELAALEVLGAQLAASLQKAEAYEQLRETNNELEERRRTFASDLEVAAQIQEQMLPLEFNHPQVDAAVHYTPHSNIGGDYAELREEDDYLYILIGDVSGHGISSALVMSALQREISRMVRELYTPDQMVIELNNFLSDNFEITGLFLTFFAGRLHLPTGRLETVNHGHPPVFLYHTSSGTTHRSTSTHFPLGMMDYGSEDAQLQNFQLKPGDRMLMYTDGMFVSRDGIEEVSEEDLLERFVRSADRHIRQASNDIVDLSQSARDELGLEPSDDRLMVTLEMRRDYSYCFMLKSLTDVEEAAEEVHQLGEWAGYTDDELNLIRLVLHELCTNAVLHGNRLDDRKTAVLTGFLQPDRWELTVEDEGEGFDPRVGDIKEVSDELDYGDFGRGLPMVNSLVDYLRFNEKGNRVTAGKSFDFVADFPYLTHHGSLFSA